MNLCDIVNTVIQTRKYTGVKRAVVERLASQAMLKYTKPKDVVKAVKKELHMIHEAFFNEKSHPQAHQELENYVYDKPHAKALMALHSSTRERLRQADEIYDFIGKKTQGLDTIVDVGCGFNPFALPFFADLSFLPTMYWALDIDRPTVGLLNQYFETIDKPYQAILHDAMTDPAPKADMLFMFKLFPLLERQKKGRGFELLGQLDYRTALVSFPLKSATGKEKGMKGFYSSLFEGGLPQGLGIVDKTVFGNEMFYAVIRSPVPA